MRISALGHAGLRVESHLGSILIDPWFSPEGAFLGSWFQYPSNEHLLSTDLIDADAFVISHEHLDHVDAWFLAQTNQLVPVFFPEYPSPILKAKVLAGGERPTYEVPEWEEREVAPGITAFFVAEESPMNHDSAMVIRVGGKTLLNMNDARLSPSQLREIRRRVGGTIDAVAIQGAGASWFPVCYRYNDDRRRELSIAKRTAKFGYAAKVHRIVEPGVLLPFAGPPAFLDADIRHANAEMGPEGIFPDQQQVADWLGSEAGIDNTAVLLPGDSWATDAGIIERDQHWSGFDFNDHNQYLDEYARHRAPELAAVHARYPAPVNDLWDEFVAYFDRVLAMSPYFNEQIDMAVGFQVTGQGGGDWKVDFRSGTEGISRGTDDCQYTYRFASNWLPPILSGEVPWEDFFLSLRFEAWRDPDLYNDHLLGLLKFAWPEALTAVEEYERRDESGETIDVTLEGVTYRIERYCPHAGQDLQETAELLPGGQLRCLGHHYEFDLATGECLNGRCRPLHTMVLELDHRHARNVAGASETAPPRLL